ncbi:hypothetical protein [Cohnella sp. GbtcB17]|uniref:hypothetical protein n=1 Tax=Cohnella sp. GbtcB17 TaxID=2824762 RepID=UPI001C2F86C2|nr:hypothetical protein [Cohnella sp. GbtcB17]
MANKGQDRRQPAAKRTQRQQAEKREATLHAKAPAKKKTGIAVKQSWQSESAEPDIPVRQIPWWFTPEHQRAHGPGGGAHIGSLLPPRPPGPGLHPGHGPHPGPGPFPPGPGPFPPGHGPFPPGPGPFPPGHGPFPPGPGPFPPGHGPFPPGPGPFPPGHGPFPPGPGPFPIPIPIPLPIPVPGPVPVPVPVPLPEPVSFVAVTVEGGIGFPNVSGTSYVTFYPGMTLRQALFATGRVQFGPNGFIVSVAGIPVGGPIGLTVRYNGRVIPQTLLDQPITPGSTITFSLFYF